MPFSHIYEHQYQAFFKRLAYYSVPYILYLTQYQAHPQLGLLVVSGLRRLQLVHKPTMYKIVQQYADENGCQGDEKALYHILIIFRSNINTVCIPSTHERLQRSEDHSSSCKQ